MAPEEFDDLYARSFHRIVGQIYAMTGNVAEAQDVVQEAFMRAWDKRSQLTLTQSPEAWVRTVAGRLAVSRWRRARSGLRAIFRHGTPEAVPSPGPDHTALVAALKKIPEQQRRAIVLHYLCDLPVAEVAEETGVPEGTVKARLARGRAALARYLSDDMLEEAANA